MLLSLYQKCLTKSILKNMKDRVNDICIMMNETAIVSIFNK